MKYSIYSTLSQKMIKILSLVISIFLLVVILLNFLSGSYRNNIIKKVSIIDNAITIILFIMLYINPTKVNILAFIAFQYSVLTFLLEPVNPMGPLMYYLGISVLLLRGSYKKNKKRKVIITVVLFFILLLSKIKFGFDSLYTVFIVTLGYALVLSLIIVFLFFYISNSIQERRKMLNLAEYPGLKARDAEWLRMIQSRIKYESIAISEQVSLGTVKNRIKIIFNTLEVGDKVGFLNKYEDFEIFFDGIEEIVSEKE